MKDGSSGLPPAKVARRSGPTDERGTPEPSDPNVCLQLYCDCFSRNLECTDSCGCVTCHPGNQLTSKAAKADIEVAESAAATWLLQLAGFTPPDSQSRPGISPPESVKTEPISKPHPILEPPSPTEPSGSVAPSSATPLAAGAGAATSALTPAPGKPAKIPRGPRGSYRCGKCGVPKKGHVCPATMPNAPGAAMGTDGEDQADALVTRPSPSVESA